MPEERLQNLLWSAVVSIPLVALSVAILKGRVPLLGFRPRPGESPREAPLWGWAEIFLVLAVWLLLQQAVFPAFFLLAGERAAVAFAWTQLVVALALFWTLRVWVLDRIGGRWGTLGLSGTSVRSIVTTVVLGALSLIPLGVAHGSWGLLLEWILGEEPPAQDLVRLYAGLVQEGDWVSVGHLVAAGVILAPLVEETVFRGFLYGALRLRWGSGLAAVAASLPFALAHFSLGAFPALFLLGCLFCLLYERSGSLLGPMLFHGLFNGLQFATLLVAGPRGG